MTESKQPKTEGRYNRKWVIILTHVAVWAIILALPYLLNSHYDDSRPQQARRYEREFFYLGFFTNFLWIVAFYLNAYTLTPRLFVKKKYAAYVALYWECSRFIFRHLKAGFASVDEVLKYLTLSEKSLFLLPQKNG